MAGLSIGRILTRKFNASGEPNTTPKPDKPMAQKSGSILLHCQVVPMERRLMKTVHIGFAATMVAWFIALHPMVDWTVRLFCP